MISSSIIKPMVEAKARELCAHVYLNTKYVTFVTLIALFVVKDIELQTFEFEGLLIFPEISMAHVLFICYSS